MEKNITLLIALFVLGIMHAQAPALQWQKTLGGTDYDHGTCIKPTPDGGYIISGTSQSNDGNVEGHYGGYDIWIVKLSATGGTQWRRSFGGTYNDEGLVIEVTSDGGYVVGGLSYSSDGDVTLNQGYSDLWVVKLNSQGIIQWQQSLGGSGLDQMNSIKPCPDGGYIAVGASTSSDGEVTGNHGSWDVWVVKLNANGTMQWQKSFGGTGDDGAWDVQNTPDGGYVVAAHNSLNNGDVTGNHGILDYWVIKLDAAGVIQWQKSFGGSNVDVPRSIQVVSDGGYVLSGYSSSSDGDITGNHGNYDYWVIKLDSAGVLQWQKSLGGSNADQAWDIQITQEGGFVVAGGIFSNDGDVTGYHGNGDFWIIKLDVTGNIQWQKCFGGEGQDRAESIQITPDGGYIVAGSSASLTGEVIGNHGNYDYWIVKLAPDSLVTANLEQDRIVIYPNPVGNVLQMQIPANLLITWIKIVDISGKVILEQYQNSTTVNLENFAQGIYILEAYSGEEKYTSKFVKE